MASLRCKRAPAVTHIIEVGSNLARLLHELFGERDLSHDRLAITQIEYLDSGVIIKGDIVMATLKENQQVRFTVKPRTAKGNLGKVQPDSVEWASSDEAIATVEEDATNELSAVVKAVGPEGEATITFSADADLGEGVTTISGVGAVQVIAGDTVGFDLSEGVPEDQAA